MPYAVSAAIGAAGAALGEVGSLGWGTAAEVGGVSQLSPQVQQEEQVLAQELITKVNSVYQGIDANGIIRYIGITGRDVTIRFAEHLNSGTERGLLDYRVVNGAQGLSRIDARIWEQNLINQYGLNNLYNMRNSISPQYWEQYGIKP